MTAAMASQQKYRLASEHSLSIHFDNKFLGTVVFRFKQGVGKSKILIKSKMLLNQKANVPRNLKKDITEELGHIYYK